MAVARSSGRKWMMACALAMLTLPLSSAAAPDTITKEIQKKLNAHHAEGATSEDPLLFRYRYQHHTIDTDRLVYYQYEARRHAHVVMLEDFAVQACSASPGADERTAVTLTVDGAALDKMGVSAGSIIVGRAGKGCFASAEDGLKMWQAKLQERVVEPPLVTATRDHGVASLMLVTVPASLHECFEYSQVEFYHGGADRLHVARTKRLQSLESKGKVPPADVFASTSTVVADAKAASARKQAIQRLVEAKVASTRERADPNSPLERPTNLTVAGRALSHWCYGGMRKSQEIPVWLAGTDCSDKSPDDAAYVKDCYWRRGGEWALAPTKRYQLRWHMNGKRQQVRIRMFERDSGMFNGDDYCFEIRDYAYTYSGITNSYSFSMPELADLRKRCQSDGHILSRS